MIGWLLLFGGILVGFIGTTVAVGVRSVPQIELYRWVAAGTENASAARTLLAEPGRIAGTALGLAAVGAILVGLAWRGILVGMPTRLLILAVAAAGVPLFLWFAHALPRVAGRRWAESTIRRTVPIVARIAPILSPLREDYFEEPAGQDQEAGGAPGSSLRTDTQEIELVSGVLAFSERPVREVMTPRTDITAVPEGLPVNDVGRVFADERYSRIPVFRESLDNIVGMVYAFDLLKLDPGAELPVRPVTVVHVSKPCADLLFEMQRERRQMAVVLDEYGGTAGIATLQDLLEELVGETFDTGDDMGSAAASEAGVLEVLGTAEARMVADHFRIELPGDAETVSGLLSRSAGRIPKAGERFELAGLEFDILEATATRVERIAVRRGVTSAVKLDSGDRR